MKAPRPLVLDTEKLGQLQPETRTALDEVFAQLNPFLLDTSTVLDGGLTTANTAAVVKTVQVVQPPLSWVSVASSGSTDPYFKNSWANVASYSAAGFWIDDYGRVHLRGRITTSGAINTVAFTLPVGYRPPATRNFAVIANASAVGEVKIEATGAVTVVAGSITATSLDGISFEALNPAPFAASVGTGWPIQLEHGLQNRITGVQLLHAEDVDAAVSQSPAGCGLDWSVTRSGQVEIRRVSGLMPQRSYRLTFLITAGDG